jgi:8-oxo-dGTP pyrophosphatase MutT (NUDIX family)
VRREVLEEAGLAVGPVAIVGSQPWPIGRLPLFMQHRSCSLSTAVSSPQQQMPAY